MNATLLTVSIAFTSGFVTTAILMYWHYRKQLENLDGNWTRVPDDDGVRTYVRAYNSSRNVRTALDAVNECQRRPSSPSPGADGPSGDGATAARPTLLQLEGESYNAYAARCRQAELEARPTPFRLTVDASGVTSREAAERIRRYIMPEQYSRNPADVLADMGVSRDSNWQAWHDYLEATEVTSKFQLSDNVSIIGGSFKGQIGKIMELYSDDQYAVKLLTGPDKDRRGTTVIRGSNLSPLLDGEPLPMPPAPNMGGVGNPQYEGPDYAEQEDIAAEHFGTLPRGEEA